MPEGSVTDSLRIQVVWAYGRSLAGDEETYAAPAVAPVHIDEVACIACGACVAACLRRVLTIQGESAQVVEGHESWCSREGACVEVCPTGAIRIQPLPGPSEATGEAGAWRGEAETGG